MGEEGGGAGAVKYRNCDNQVVVGMEVGELFYLSICKKYCPVHKGGCFA